MYSVGKTLMAIGIIIAALGTCLLDNEAYIDQISLVVLGGFALLGIGYFIVSLYER